MSLPRERLLPYGRQKIEEDDIQAVVDVLRSDWITTGPKVEEFEQAVARYVGARYGVSFSSGTAALHGAASAAGLCAGAEAITTPLTFCATANAVLYTGATPVFCDIRPDTLTIDVNEVAQRINSRTRALLPVDYAGHPADLAELMALAREHNLVVIEDACHALGAEYSGRRIGGIAHMTVFSFHPVKHITTGEGGMVTTDDPDLARKLRAFRSHGIESDARSRQALGQWYYEMTSLGYNYRLSDIHCALGLSQLRRIDANLARRRTIAGLYSEAFRGLPGITLPGIRENANPAWHLYPLRFDLADRKVGKPDLFRALRSAQLGVNVHYVPVHLHPYYRSRFGYRKGSFPLAEKAYEQLISLPMFHAMTDEDVQDVISIVTGVVIELAGRVCTTSS